MSVYTADHLLAPHRHAYEKWPAICGSGGSREAT